MLHSANAAEAAMILAAPALFSTHAHDPIVDPVVMTSSMMMSTFPFASDDGQTNAFSMFFFRSSSENIVCVSVNLSRTTISVLTGIPVIREHPRAINSD